MKYDEVLGIVQKRYNLSAAESREVLSGLIRDKMISLRNSESEIVDILESLENKNE